MIRKLPGISVPNNNDNLWKYMSFEKFVSLLDTESLFFTRADKFDDPFEGFTPPSVMQHYESTTDISTLENFKENLPKYILCSCWHHAEEESMAMWEKYHMHNSGIAIKTTFGNFENCLIEDDDVYLGNIEYINPYEYQTPKNLVEMSMLYTWYFHKRNPFEYEQEFRAILVQYPTTIMDYIDKHGNIINSDPKLKDDIFRETCDTGRYFNVDLSLLIDEIITSPYYQNWITDTVRSIVKQYDFDFEVHASKILKKPS